MIEQVAGIYYDQGVRNIIVAPDTSGQVLGLEPRLGYRSGLDYQHRGGHADGRATAYIAEHGLPATRPFFLTYGDGMADVNLRALVDHHERMREKYDALMTVTASRPPSRFGSFPFRGHGVGLREKPNIDKGWINAGFYVVERGLLDLIPAPEPAWSTTCSRAGLAEQAVGASAPRLFPMR